MVPVSYGSSGGGEGPQAVKVRGGERRLERPAPPAERQRLGSLGERSGASGEGGVSQTKYRRGWGCRRLRLDRGSARTAELRAEPFPFSTEPVTQFLCDETLSCLAYFSTFKGCSKG